MKDFPKIVTRLLGGESSGLIGPVGFVRVTTEVGYMGLVNLVYVLGGLSISLAIFQLIPLPPLDGGHVLFAVLELIKGKPLDRRVFIFIQAVGFTLLLMLFLLITYTDIMGPMPRL
jgi:regulator of sigma E protease